MPVYEIRLQSQENRQSRIVSLEAPDLASARTNAELAEVDLVKFSLLPPDKEAFARSRELAAQHARDGHAVIDLNRWDAHDPGFARYVSGLDHAGAVTAAQHRFHELAQKIDIDNSGKVRGSALTPRGKARYLAHHQQLPYLVTDAREVPIVEIDTQRLVRELASLRHNKSHDPDAWERLLTDLAEQGIHLNAVTASLYGLTSQHMLDGSAAITWSSDTIKNALHTSSYTPNNDTDDFFNDATNEASGTAYVAGGNTLGSKASTYDTASDQPRLDAADSSWSTSTITARISTVYKSTGTSSTSALMGFVNFGADVSTTAGMFQITWDATGIIVYDVT